MRKLTLIKFQNYLRYHSLKFFHIRLFVENSIGLTELVPP